MNNTLLLLGAVAALVGYLGGIIIGTAVLILWYKGKFRGLDKVIDKWL